MSKAPSTSRQDHFPALEQFDRQSGSFDPVQSDREFRIFASDFSMAVLIPHMLELAQQQGAAVRFHLMPQNRQPRHSLEQGDADLLVIPRDYCSADHPTELLFNEAFCCVVWNQSRHARQGLTRDQYIAAGHVVMQPPAMGQSLEAIFMQRTGIARKVEVTSYSFVAAPFLVVGTDRIATIHRRLARQLSASLPITVLPLPVPIDGMAQVMQWHQYRGQDPGMLWLRGLMHAAVQRMDAV